MVVLKILGLIWDYYELPEDKNFEEIQEVYDSELILKNGNIIKLKNLSDRGR